MIVQRKIQKIIEQDLFTGGKKQAAIIIYGARQVGKTTLVKQLIKNYPKNAEYYNCDYLDVQQLFAYENIGQLKGMLHSVRLLVLDEAQRIKNIGLVLKILVDEFPQLQVIATGSSSFDLSNQINEPLTGRKKVFNLYPFSFGEIADDKNHIEKQWLISSNLRFGMYPGLLTLNEHESEILLKELCSSYLFKDIFTFQQIKKPEALERLLRLLAFQIGHEVSFHELSKKVGVDQTIIQRYIHLLEESFIIFRLSAYKRNLRNEISKSRKIFFWDLGIRNALIQNHNLLELRNDVGGLWENFCISERLKYLHNNQYLKNTFFWRTYQQKEIDYIEESQGNLQAWEFKWSSKKQVKIPADFARAYPETTFDVISKENFSEFISG